jgi:hypothetical protein
VSLFDLKQRINKLKAADLTSLSPEQLRNRIGLIIDDYPFELRSLEISGLYRARKNLPGTDFTNARELWYPPTAVVTKPSRLNGIGQARLYAASMPNTTILELKPEIGDVFTVLIARTKSRTVELMKNLAFIGIERSLAPELSMLTKDDVFRTSSRFRQNLGEVAYKKWLLVDDFLSSILGETITDANAAKYRLTAALGDLVFEAPQINAVCYPSVATSNRGINICLLPDKADSLFEPSEAWAIRIEGQDSHPDVDSPLHRISFKKRSKEIGPDGVINWLPPGIGIDEEAILRFVRRRLQRIASLPQPA